jgi:hypothetical protein
LDFPFIQPHLTGAARSPSFFSRFANSRTTLRAQPTTVGHRFVFVAVADENVVVEMIAHVLFNLPMLQRSLGPLWAAGETQKFAIATVPHKGARLRLKANLFLLYSYLDADLREFFTFSDTGMVVISARRTVFTDSNVVKTLAISGSSITTR